MSDAARYDGRGHEPPYVTDAEAAERGERERCAVIAETLEFKMNVRDWIDMSKKQISERIAREIAEAIRNQ